MNFKKLYISLLTALAVGSLLATSDSPNSSSSSSLTANMSDATESNRTKRKGIDAAILDDMANEEESFGRQKTLRLGTTPSTLALPMSFSPNPISPNISSLPSPSSLTVAPKNKATSFPVQFYSSSHLVDSFEYLDYRDLKAARAVSKNFTFFKDAAQQALMPSGKQWVSWFNQKFNTAKTVPQQLRVLSDATAAIVRSPNPVIKLREIVQNYYSDVPQKLRLWNVGIRGKFLPIKQPAMLREELEIVALGIAALKEHEQTEETKQELENLKARHQEIVSALIPYLHALTPYSAANIILSELAYDPNLPSIIPEYLPLLPQNKSTLEGSAVEILLKKFIPRGLMALKTTQLLPSIYATLVTQPGLVNRATRPCLERRLLKSINYRSFDRSVPIETLISNDQTDIEYYNLKIGLLRKTLRNIIFQDKKTSRMGLEKALNRMRTDHLIFLCKRIADYLKFLEQPNLRYRDTVIQHTFYLMTTSASNPSELIECRTIVESSYNNNWHAFLMSNIDYKKITMLLQLARCANRAALLAGSTLTQADLRYAIHYNLAVPQQFGMEYVSAEQSDQLITEFGDGASAYDYLVASYAQAAVASKTPNAEIAQRHLNAATQYMVSAQQMAPTVSYTNTLWPIKGLERYLEDIERLNNLYGNLPRACVQLAAHSHEITKNLTSKVREKIRQLKQEAAAAQIVHP